MLGKIYYRIVVFILTTIFVMCLLVGKRCHLQSAYFYPNHGIINPSFGVFGVWAHPRLFSFLTFFIIDCYVE